MDHGKFKAEYILSLTHTHTHALSLSLSLSHTHTHKCIHERMQPLKTIQLVLTKIPQLLSIGGHLEFPSLTKNMMPCQRELPSGKKLSSKTYNILQSES